jgi:hypothetical protein
MGASPSQPAPAPAPAPARIPLPVADVTPSWTFTPTRFNETIDLMSLYHPFPIRLDTPGSGTNIQYDACLQIGEFGVTGRNPNKNVFLIPLKVDANPGDGAKFINTLGSKIPAIVGAQPDILLGYPDVDVSLGAEWSLAQVLKVNRSYYTWVTSEGTRVIAMAEPILISGADMEGIKRLPVTPPEDVIHEITAVRYKPAPPIDKRGNPIACPNKMLPVIPLPMAGFKPDVEGKNFMLYLMGPLAVIIIIILVWFGLKMAIGPTGTLLKTVGDSLGRSLAGGYDALKKVKLPVMPAMPAMPPVIESVKTTRRNLANRLGLGEGSKFPKKRDTSIEEVFPVIKPSGDIEVTNPLFKSKSDFANFQERNRTRKNSKRGSINNIANLPPVKGSTEEIIQDMPPGVTVTPRIRKTGSINSIRGLPELANTPAPALEPATPRRGSISSIRGLPELANTPAPKDTPAEIANTPAPKDTPAEIANTALDGRKKKLSSALKKLSAANQANKTLGEVRTLRELNELDSAPPPIPTSRNKTLRNSTLKVIAAKQAEKKLGQIQAKREMDTWFSDEPAPAPASAVVPPPVPAKEPLIPKSEFETWDRSRQSTYVQKLKKDYAQRVVNGYVARMKTTIGDKPQWNPSTKIDSPLRIGKKGGRKRRNRRKTVHRKKTGRRI